MDRQMTAVSIVALAVFGIRTREGGQGQKQHCADGLFVALFPCSCGLVTLSSVTCRFSSKGALGGQL